MRSWTYLSEFLRVFLPTLAVICLYCDQLLLLFLFQQLYLVKNHVILAVPVCFVHVTNDSFYSRLYLP